MKVIIPNLEIAEIALGKTKQLSMSDYYLFHIGMDNISRYYPARLNCYQLSLCLSGWITIRVNGEEIRYTANMLAASTPATILETMEVSDDFQCVMVVFQKSFLVETLNNIYFLERFCMLNSGGLNYRYVTDEEATMLHVLFGDIHEKIKQVHHPFKREIVRSLIIILLYEVEHIINGNSGSIKPADRKSGSAKLVSDFQNLLQKYSYRERKVVFYASQLFVSSDYLTRILKKETGRTAKEHIEDLVITQAKVWLKSREYNVSQVASLLHYLNIEEFSRFFKRRTGYSPQNYRKRE